MFVCIFTRSHPLKKSREWLMLIWPSAKKVLSCDNSFRFFCSLIVIFIYRLKSRNCLISFARFWHNSSIVLHNYAEETSARTTPSYVKEELRRLIGDSSVFKFFTQGNEMSCSHIFFEEWGDQEKKAIQGFLALGSCERKNAI